MGILMGVGFSFVLIVLLLIGFVCLNIFETVRNIDNELRRNSYRMCPIEADELQKRLAKKTPDSVGAQVEHLT